uniref:Uncharacterized protein n=1 Tax=Candidatus Kentrum sp. LFY TaxID=2126342 RepID=A0A450WEA0_9GAMM|nr:MAG: hypothetical protein BECKLFY1418C_GA0070996_101438 [Candidatus Kentron sp. LFY]
MKRGWKWTAFTYQGTNYELSHLHPFEWSYVVEASENRLKRAYKFQVEFSMHCFTRRPRSDESVPEDLWYRDSVEERVFCFDRYQLSHRLPAIIKELGSRKCMHTSGKNSFLTTELITKKGKEIEYEVYFNVTRAHRGGGWLNITVKSAYERTQNHPSKKPKRKRRIRFDVIAYNRQLGKEIHPAG